MSSSDHQDFEQRLSEWIASQGFWFQLRHSMSGGGVSGAMFQLVRIGFRLLIVLAIAAAGFAFYLSQRVGSEGFRESVTGEIESALAAEEVEMQGFNREGGRALIRRLGLTGSGDSFFQSLEAGNLSFDMELLDGFAGKWDGGTAEMSWLDAELRAGANSKEEAEAVAEMVLEPYPDFGLRSIEAASTRLSWGYFERTYGSISESRMTANRTEDGWRFAFEGGRFSQNWLRRLTIDELVVLVTPDGLAFESGVLRAGQGTVTFRDVRVTGGTNPKLSGDLVFDRVPLDILMPPKIGEMISGTVSATLTLGGSLNSSEGVRMDGRVELSDQDRITVRDNLHLFNALDVVDVYNSYRRVDFERGGFDLKTGSGRMEVTDLGLTAGELVALSGGFTVREPRDEEIEELIGRSSGDSADITRGLSEEEGREMMMTLERAGKASGAASPWESGEGENHPEEGESGGDDSEFLDDMVSSRDLRRDYMERARRLFRFDGEVEVTVPGNAFQRSASLRERYPVDPEEGRAVIEVPLEGSSLGQLTLKEAENILRLGSQRD